MIASLSMASTGAYAANSPVTTKDYVDAGLQYVYDVANGRVTGTVQTLESTIGTASTNEANGTGLIGRVESVENAIGTASEGETPGTGLTGAVESLQDTIGDANGGLIQRINSLEAVSQTYNGVDGIAITAGANEGDPSTIGLALPTDQNNEVAQGTYVYTVDANGGSWQQLDVATTWDSTVIH